MSNGELMTTGIVRVEGTNGRVWWCKHVPMEGEALRVFYRWALLEDGT